MHVSRRLVKKEKEETRRGEIRKKTHCTICVRRTTRHKFIRTTKKQVKQILKYKKVTFFHFFVPIYLLLN